MSLSGSITNKEVGGASTEIVLELMRRSKYTYSIDLLPWKRAYEEAQQTAYPGVYSTTRSDKRENLFKWVGPIAENNYVLLGTKKRNIKLQQFDAAKKYSVGAYLGSVTVDILEKAGIEPEVVHSDKLNVLKLGRDRIDLWITGHLPGVYLAKQYGITGLQEAYQIRKRHMYIAFSLETPDSIINNLNDILQTMREEGFFESVYQRYL